MLIECPFCHARAQIADSKEGAKVRCGECGRVYGARPVGSGRGKSSKTNLTPFIIGGVVVIAGALLWLLTKDAGKRPRMSTDSVVEKPEPPKQEYGWKAPAVQDAAKMHTDAKSGNRTPLTVRLSGADLWAAKRGEDDPMWDEFDKLEQNAKLELFVDELVDASNSKGVANWTPYNGSILSEDMGVITVRLQCTPAEGGIEKRDFEWQLRQEGERFKVLSWSRFEEPVKSEKGSPTSLKGVEKVALSDGSVVIERTPEPLAHLDSTSPELRAEIDSLYAKIIDLSLTKEMSQAKLRLQEIGKPAMPRLLTGLYEIPLDDIDNARRVQNIVSVMRKITGQYFGFEPLTLVGSAMGTTEERRASSIKQWFAWWYRNGEAFSEVVKEDALNDLIEMTPEDKAWLDRHKD